MIGILVGTKHALSTCKRKELSSCFLASSKGFVLSPSRGINTYKNNVSRKVKTPYNLEWRKY